MAPLPLLVCGRGPRGPLLARSEYSMVGAQPSTPCASSEAGCPHPLLPYLVVFSLHTNALHKAWMGWGSLSCSSGRLMDSRFPGRSFGVRITPLLLWGIWERPRSGILKRGCSWTPNSLRSPSFTSKARKPLFAYVATEHPRAFPFAHARHVNPHPHTNRSTKTLTTKSQFIKP